MKTKQKNIKIIILAVVVIIAGIFLFTFTQKQSSTTQVITQEGENIMITNGVKHLVPLDEILSGGPPKDGIPSIDKPKFISPEDATWLKDDEIVFGISLNGISRAYPKQILVWHEIVNDKFGDIPVLVTYCPLCGTAIAFERKLPNGEEVEFGTSGKLWKSNLVMYDRKTDSYWSQVTGKAIVGELTNSKLKQLPIETLLFKDWKKEHTDTFVLSRNTGHLRSYGVDPYGGYYSDRDVGFGASFSDTRLHPKAMVTGIEISNKSKAYPVLGVVNSGNVVNDFFGNVNILAVIDPNLQINDFEINPMKIFDRNVDDRVYLFEIINGKLFDQDKNEWSFEGKGLGGLAEGKQMKQLETVSAMWFSWLNAHPHTELFK